MKWIFWAAASILAYTYLGYAAVLWLYSRVRPRPVRKASIEPSVSVVMAVHGAPDDLGRKLENLLLLDYPRDRYEIIVVSDAASDQTKKVLESCTSAVRAVVLSEHQGKAVALNRGVVEARGEVIVFTDVRQRIERGALRALVCNFADEEVGCVSGELILGSEQEESRTVGIYWLIEKYVRKLESAAGSVVGVTGALYAVRKWLFIPLPTDTLLDDVLVPLSVARRGKRVVFEAAAKAWDHPPFDWRTEFRRKVRTLAGNYQLARVARWIFTPENPLLLQFVSHKLLRLLAPFCLAMIFAISWFLWTVPFYFVAAVAQTVFYLAGIAGLLGKEGRDQKRAINLASTFCLLNAAAAVAFWRFVVCQHDAKQLWLATRVPPGRVP